MESNTLEVLEPHALLAVYDAGFGEDLIPIIPPDAHLSPGSKIALDQRGKVPGELGPSGWRGFNWRQLQTTRRMVERWIADRAGVGLRTRRFPTIDVDVQDEELAGTIEQVLSKQLGIEGHVLKRIGQAPKFAIPCRSDQPFGKMKWTLRDGSGNPRGAIEILGDGQQFVIYGLHPKTGKPYTWSEAGRKADVKLLAQRGASGLPAISREQFIDTLLPALQESLSERGIQLEQSGSGRSSPSGPAPDQETLRAPDILELRKAVAAIPNDEAWEDRGDYISMGIAIKAAAGPEFDSDGFELFLDWALSWTGGINDPAQVRAEWDSFKPPFLIGWEWIVRRARPHGYSDAAHHFESLADSTVVLPPPPPDERYTDMGNAGRFSRRYRDTLRYVPGRGWLRWDGRRWAVDDTAQVLRLAKAVVRDMHAEADQIQDEKIRDALRGHARGSEAERRLRSMVNLAAPELTMPTAGLDSDPWLLNVANGVLDLRTGSLSPHDANLHQTKLTGSAFSPEATAPTWLAFLNTIFEGDSELIEFVQRAVGYSLTGTTNEQVFFLLHGTGANGKSTFLETLREVLGDYATQAEFSTFLVRKGTGARNDIARLHGSRLVAAAEAEADERLAEATVKQLTGGDVITARYLYKELFEFRPQFKLWLAANHKPAIRGSDHAIWRRIHLIPFHVTIPEESRDPNLVNKLKAERDGILRWALEGCLVWQRDGLRRPSAVRHATDGYRAEMDWLTAFVQDCCIVAPGAQTDTKELYDAFDRWAQGRGEVPVTKPVFNERLASHEPARIRRIKTGGYWVWRGVELRPVPLSAATDQENSLGQHAIPQLSIVH